MEKVKETKEYTVYKKRSGRFGVKNSQNKWLNGEEKVKVLLDNKLITVSKASKKAEPAKEEESTEAAAEESATEEKKDA